MVRTEKRLGRELWGEGRALLLLTLLTMMFCAQLFHKVWILVFCIHNRELICLVFVLKKILPSGQPTWCYGTVVLVSVWHQFSSHPSSCHAEIIRAEMELMQTGLWFICVYQYCRLADKYRGGISDTHEAEVGKSGAFLTLLLPSALGHFWTDAV